MTLPCHTQNSHVSGFKFLEFLVTAFSTTSHCKFQNIDLSIKVTLHQICLIDVEWMLARVKSKYNINVELN